MRAWDRQRRDPNVHIDVSQIKRKKNENGLSTNLASRLRHRRLWQRSNAMQNKKLIESRNQLVMLHDWNKIKKKTIVFIHRVTLTSFTIFVYCLFTLAPIVKRCQSSFKRQINLDVWLWQMIATVFHSKLITNSLKWKKKYNAF